ncbi:WD40 repeat-like protein [Suillus weaverae]|nr:WD40 repeat-like protein [Suillus weaverae]
MTPRIHEDDERDSMVSQVYEDDALPFRDVSSWSDAFSESSSNNSMMPITYKAKALPKASALLRDYKSKVMDATFIPGTRLLVTSPADKRLRVWDLDTRKQVREPLLGHDAAVLRVAASADGRWIVSGGWNGSILVWEVATNKRDLKRVPMSFEGHKGGIQGVVFAPDSQTFASASEDETICVWKRETGKIVLGPLNVGSWALSVSYSLDGKKLAAGTQEHIIIWNTKTGEELLKIKQRAWRVAFTPDGLRLVSGNRKDIRISDAATGDIIKQFDAHTDNFYSLAIAPNGTKFATTSFDKTTRFFDLTTFKLIGEPLEHPDVVSGLAFSEDSQLIATGCADKHQETIPDLPSQDDELPPRFFDDVRTDYPPRRSNHLPYGVLQRSAPQSQVMTLVNRLPFRRQSQQARPSAGHLHHPNKVTHFLKQYLPFRRSIPSPGQPQVVDVAAGRGKERVIVVSVPHYKKVHDTRRPPREEPVTYDTAQSDTTDVSSSSDVSAESSLMTSTTHEDDSLFKVSAFFEGHESMVMDVTFIPGTRLLATCSDDKSIRVWDLDTWEQVGEPLLGHNTAVWRVAASPDGRWIVSSGENGSILAWEVATNKPSVHTFKSHTNTVLGVVFAPDSETFASASEDKTVCVWKRETGEIALGPLQVGSEAYSVSYSPNGRKLAAGTEKHIIIWNAETGEELLKIEQRAWRVAFTPDGLRLISGNRKDIRITDVITGDIIKQFDVHHAIGLKPFESLAVAPNGTKFATTSWDKTTRFFDLTTFEPIGEPLEHPGGVWGVAFSEDSQLIATSCADKFVRTWTVPPSESEKELQEQATIPDLPSQDDEFPPRFFDDVRSNHPPRRSNHLPYGVPQRSAPQSRIMALVNRLPFRRQSQQEHPSAGHLHPRRAPIPTSRFFDDFDPHSPPGRNNHAATTMRHAEGSKIKNMMNSLFSRSSAPQGHAPRPRRIPLVDVFATRGKYRTANAHSGKRHKLMQLQRPPRQQAHTASSSSTPQGGTSNVTGGATSATLQTGSTSATHRPPSPLNVEHVSDTSCFAVLTRYFPRLSRTSVATPHPR